jgi:hypothetical protein
LRGRQELMGKARASRHRDALQRRLALYDSMAGFNRA